MNNNDRFTIDSFMSYIMTHPEEDPFSSKWKASANQAKSEGQCNILAILFIAAIIFICIAAPVLCIAFLLTPDAVFEGIWVFWLITAGELGFLFWRIIKQKSKRFK